MNDMMLSFFASLIFPLMISSGPAQKHGPILWTFQYSVVSDKHINIIANASLAPGWHIYSQFLGEGGPMPTEITFFSNDTIQTIGNTNEDGVATSYFDNLYDMEIVWYSGRVSFTQTIRVHHAPVNITGQLRYMTCNEYLCIPGSSDFSIPINSRK